MGVIALGRKNLERNLTLSSELVPFQEIDVYAKESGFVRELKVDYGSRVKAGQVMAVLEIPELEVQIRQDEAMIKRMASQVANAEHQCSRVEAEHEVRHLQYHRLDNVAKSNPGLVAQQEVDDAQGRDLESEAKVEGTKATLEAAQNQLAGAQAQQERDKVLFQYAQITAPFDGVVTQRFANLGTLVQAGTSSSTQALPIVRLSQDNLFRLVIPVPESYVKFIKVGDSVLVHVPSLDRTVPGRVARFSVDVKEDTRTMHTEVDVPNPDHVLMPGVFAEATLTLEQRTRALAVPLQAINREGDETTVTVVNPVNRIENRQVILGLETPTDVEVISGLRDGDRIVVSDRSNLKPGENVRSRPVEIAGIPQQ